MVYSVSFNVLKPLKHFQVHCMSIRGKIKQLPASSDHNVCKYHENYAKQSFIIIFIYTAAATADTEDTSRSLSLAWAWQLELAELVQSKLDCATLLSSDLSSVLVSWSSLECPLSLLVSLSLSESSSSFELFLPGSVCAASGLEKTCWPKEKMDTRLVIWSTSIPLAATEPSRKAGWKTWR